MGVSNYGDVANFNGNFGMLCMPTWNEGQKFGVVI